MQKQIYIYINNLINEYNIDITSIPVLPASPQMPLWEHINAKFHTDYLIWKKVTLQTF